MLRTECWVLSAECWVLSAECWVLSTEFWLLSAECLLLQSTAARGKKVFLQQVVCQERKQQIDCCFLIVVHILGQNSHCYSPKKEAIHWRLHCRTILAVIKIWSWAQSVECWVLSYECWLLIADCWVLSAECWVLSAECLVLSADCWVLSAECWVLVTTIDSC